MRATCSKLKVAINKFQKAFSFYSSSYDLKTIKSTTNKDLEISAQRGQQQLETISMFGDDSVATNSLPAEDCHCVCSLYFIIVLT